MKIKIGIRQYLVMSAIFLLISPLFIFPALAETPSGSQPLTILDLVGTYKLMNPNVSDSNRALILTINQDKSLLSFSGNSLHCSGRVVVKNREFSASFFCNSEDTLLNTTTFCQDSTLISFNMDLTGIEKFDSFQLQVSTMQGNSKKPKIEDIMFTKIEPQIVPLSKFVGTYDITPLEENLLPVVYTVTIGTDGTMGWVETLPSGKTNICQGVASTGANTLRFSVTCDGSQFYQEVNLFNITEPFNEFQAPVYTSFYDKSVTMSLKRR